MWVQANGSDLFHVPSELGHLFGQFHGETAVEDAYSYLEYIKGEYPQYF